MSSPELDPRAVLAALGVVDAERVEPATGGWSTTRVWRVDRAVARRDVLLHLDFHPLNVLVSGKQVSAVLDWANARAGDPRADVARSYSILVVAPPRQSRAVELLRRLLAAAYRRGYEREAGPL